MKEVTFLDNHLNQLFYKKDTFTAAQNIEGKVFRKYENRITKQFEAQEKKYFIKFHGPVGWKEIFKNLFQIKTPVIGAQREYEALNHLSQNNINCPQIKGFGKKGINPANSSSFIITEELYGTLSLEEFFLKNLHKNLSFDQKCNLIKSSASLISKMHLSGLNHRDLYLCHLHIKEDIDFNNIEIYLIDLHRAQIRSTVPFRWIIKDLGGFFHSAIQFNFTERDFYRFLMSYFNCSLRDLIDRHQDIIGRILDRAFSMYLKPSLKNFSRNYRLVDSKEREFDIHSYKSGKLFIEKSLDLNQFTPFFNDEDMLINKGEVIKNEKGHLIVKIKILDRYFFIKKYRIKNIFHGISRLIKRTRALNSWLMIHWLNAVGIRTAHPVLLYEKNGLFGARTSFLITEEIEGNRLDEVIDQNTNVDFVVARIESFFKRMNWIKVSHGDAKTSNFFINQKGLITFDLDSSKRRKLNFFHNKAIYKDKNRILKSLEKNDQVYLKLSKRLIES
tara:strand:+ start:308 stop:1813 length:1506 start_codon:yes stop_codon:yes gene_type:complete